MKEVKFTPLGSNVLVKRVETATKSAGGIIIPETAREKPFVGIVVAVSRWKTLDNGSRADMDTTIGAKVLFAKYTGNDIHLDGDDYVLIKEEELLGIVW